jgi:hypothetical protein
MKVRTKDGREFEGTARQVVTAMRDLSFAPGVDYETFIRESIERLHVEGIELVPVRDGSRATVDDLCVDFVASLVVAGVLEDVG